MKTASPSNSPLTRAVREIEAGRIVTTKYGQAWRENGQYVTVRTTPSNERKTHASALAAVQHVRNW